MSKQLPSRPILQQSTRPRSLAYRNYVKSLPSVVSGLPADDAHHVKGHGMGGAGLTAPDWATIPLTRGEHEEFHRLGAQQWEMKYGSQLEHVARTLGRAIDDGIIRL